MKSWSGEVLASAHVHKTASLCPILVPLGGQLFVIAVVPAVLFVLDNYHLMY
jgi:hypothetical protein